MLVATVDSYVRSGQPERRLPPHQVTSERIKRQLLHAPHGITRSGNRQRHPRARRKAQPARSCPPSSSQRSTSLAVSPSSWERSTSGRSATSPSVRSSGTCSVMLSPAPDVYSYTMNMLPLPDRGPWVSWATMRPVRATHPVRRGYRGQSAHGGAGGPADCDPYRRWRWECNSDRLQAAAHVEPTSGSTEDVSLMHLERQVRPDIHGQ